MPDSVAVRNEKKARIAREKRDEGKLTYNCEVLDCDYKTTSWNQIARHYEGHRSGRRRRHHR